MKRLTLLRHAKSSWKDPLLEDFDRPLNKRGKENAPMMGQRLAETGWSPELILSSPAKRARKTAQLVAFELGCDEDLILYDSRIYEADVSTLFELIRGIKEPWADVLLVGHNPGLTDLANLFAPCGLDNIVTCGALGLIFQADAWREIIPASGEPLFYDYPKKSSEN